MFDELGHSLARAWNERGPHVKVLDERGQLEEILDQQGPLSRIQAVDLRFSLTRTIQTGSNFWLVENRTLLTITSSTLIRH